MKKYIKIYNDILIKQQATTKFANKQSSRRNNTQNRKENIVAAEITLEN